MIPLFEYARTQDLTPTEREILAYFEARPAAASCMNLQELSKALYTSGATIVRFCQKLGLSGYNDFKYQIRRELKEARQTVFVAEDEIRRSVARFKDNITSLDLQTMERIAGLLTSKRPLYIYGGGLSSLPARYLQVVLNTLDFPSILVEWSRLLPGLVGTVSQDAVLFLLSVHGDTRYLPALQLAKARGLTLILVTANSQSPLLPYCTISVLTNDTEQDYHGIDIASRIGFFTVIQILIELAAGKRGE